MSSDYWVEKVRAVEREWDDLRGVLSYLVGFHEHAGAVPIQKLRAVLNDPASARRDADALTRVAFGGTGQ